jgi:hypothetical protein
VAGLPNDGRTYYWRVVVENFDGYAVDFGPTLAFRSGSSACTATAVSPVSGTIVSELDSISFRFEGTGCGPETYLVFSAAADLSGADDVRIPVDRNASGYIVTPFLIESLPFRNEPEIYWGLLSGTTVNGRLRVNSRSSTNWFRLDGKHPSWQIGASSLVVTVQGGIAAGRMTPMTLDRIDPVGAAMPEASPEEPQYMYHLGRRVKLELVPTKAVVEGSGVAQALVRGGMADEVCGEGAGGYAMVAKATGLPARGEACWRMNGAESVLPVYRFGGLEEAQGFAYAALSGRGGLGPPVIFAAGNDYSDCNYTGIFGGTSSACPVATGVSALMIGVSPEITRTQIEDILHRTATKIAPAEAQYDANGFSRCFGFGKVNAFAAVTAASAVGPVRRRFVTITNTGEGPLVASAVRTANRSEWVTRMEPRSFTLAPGVRVDVYVDFDARLAPQGTVTDMLEVVCNDPRGNVRVPLVLTRLAEGSARARLLEVATGIPGSSAADLNTDGVRDCADILRATN